jgi:iron-regulated transporter 1
LSKHLIIGSFRGILTNLATLLLSPAIGHWVDQYALRFHTIQVTIILQRVCIIVACVVWIGLFLYSVPAPPQLPEPVKKGVIGQRDLLIAIIMFFGMVERMCAVGNQFVMERDWVPTIASESSKPRLSVLNATMRRIDLISKVLAPVCVSLVAMRTSPAAMAAVIAGQNLATTSVECITAWLAWNQCDALRKDRLSGELKVDVPQYGDTERVLEDLSSQRKGLMIYFGSDVSLGKFTLYLGLAAKREKPDKEPQLHSHLLCNPSPSFPSQAR